MEKIPTAEEFLNKEYYHIVLDSKDTWVNVGDIKRAMVEFAKLHVEQALKEASEKATVTPIDHEEISEGSFRPIWGVDNDSILNSYPLNNIK